jgi:hypothetical protein
MSPNAKNIAQEALVVLSVIRMCQEFHQMPHAGGMLDQDSVFIFILQHVLTWDAQRAELDRSKQKAKTH